jgi:antitoxin Phd
MKVYTYSEARQRLARLLDEAFREGRVQIRRRDGRTFTVTPVQVARSPLDVPGLRCDLTTEDIVEAVRIGRERNYEAPALPNRGVQRRRGSSSRGRTPAKGPASRR